MASGKASLVLQPLESADFVSTLRSFRRLLSSCLGPQGGIKILISGAGCNTFTSSSLRLLNNITLSDPICLFIGQIIKSHLNVYDDHGLYIGILITSLLENILSYNIGHSIVAVSHVMEQLNLMVVSLLNLDCIRLKVDFSTVKHLLPLVRSKPMCGLTETEKQSLQINIVKAFLQTVSSTVGDVLVLCTESPQTTCQVFSGVLYQINSEDTSTLNEKCKKRGGVSLLLFNMMLTDEVNTNISENRCVKLPEGWKKDAALIEEALNFFQLVVQMNIDVVACQKVVHPALHVFLKRKGILLLDRMGTELTLGVEKLSGATPICSIRHCPRDAAGLRALVGSVEVIRLVECGQKNYVVLEKTNSSVATLVAPALNEEAAAELKVVINQTLRALRILVACPYVVPGAGCFEMSLAVRLQYEALKICDNFTCTRSQLELCVSWLQMALLSAEGLRIENLSFLMVDSLFGHIWKLEQKTCYCGLVSADVINEANGKWTEVFSNESSLLLQDTRFLALSSDSLVIKEKAVIDLYKSKKNAIELSLENCVNLLSMGMVVYKIPQE